jgi:ADP-ribose pyrophosphatase YjhB (NUDIX family)
LTTAGPSSSRQIRPGVSAVILDAAGRVLLQRRTDNDRWGLPGGAVEYGESVVEALDREVREETGLAIEIGRLIGIYSHPDHHQIVTYPDGNVIHFVSACFECAPAGGVLTLSDETSALAWFAPAECPADLVPAHRIRIADALARAGTPFIR